MTTLHTIKDSHWRASIPLSQAAIHFAPMDLQNKWRELSKRHALNEAKSHYQANMPSNTSWMDHFAAMADGAQSLVMARADVMKQAKAQLLRALLHGKYNAFGFEYPRKLSSDPLEIPAALWHGRIDWSGNELRSQSLRFVEIRLLPNYGHRQSRVTIETPPQPIFLEQTQDHRPEPQPAPTPAKAGRPSIKGPVRDAFHALAANGQINPMASAKSHYPLVRDWIATHDTEAGIDADRLSDEGIRAHFSPLFGNFKKHRKQ